MIVISLYLRYFCSELLMEKPMLDKLKGYKTVAFNVIMSAVTVIALFNPDAVLPDATMVETNLKAVYGALLGMQTVGNLILRGITTTPVFKKETPPNA